MFATEIEIEHSEEILMEFLELLMTRFQPLMNFAKLKGDVVFKPLIYSK